MTINEFIDTVPLELEAFREATRALLAKSGKNLDTVDKELDLWFAELIAYRIYLAMEDAGALKS